MNVRERFLTVMECGRAAPPKWEFGYWGANYANWYRECGHRQGPSALPRVPAHGGNPPEVHWEEFRYYRKKLNEMVDAAG